MSRCSHPNVAGLPMRFSRDRKRAATTPRLPAAVLDKRTYLVLTDYGGCRKTHQPGKPVMVLPTVRTAGRRRAGTESHRNGRCGHRGGTSRLLDDERAYRAMHRGNPYGDGTAELR